MNFASSYDLINGPVHSKAAFDRAVDETTVDASVKAWAKEFEVRVWGNDTIPKTVTQTGPDTVQFDVTGAKVIADVTIGTESSPLPLDLTRSPIVLMNEILAAQDNYIGACAIAYEDLVTETICASGAMASGSGDSVTTDIYGPKLLTSFVAEPHTRSQSFP